MKTKLIATLLVFALVNCGTEKTEVEGTPETTESTMTSKNIDLMSDMELFLFSEELEKNLIDEESLEVSRGLSVKLLETAQKHIEKFPKSEYRRELIRKGSRAAQGLGQDFEAVKLIEIAISENKNDPTIIDEMNLRAFLFDKMDNKKKAQEAYEEIIAKYPDHESVKMHKERLKTLHMTEDELIKLFEERNAK
ncbi:MAG: hypothetical protein ABF264_01745 [Flavobacteriales bacterium]